MIEEGTDPREKIDILREEYRSQDRMWRDFYPKFAQFKQDYDAAENRLLGVGDEDESGEVPLINPLTPEDRELTEEEKEEVKARDRWRCLCCDYDNERYLEVDHVRPRVLGGPTSRENSQTLCTHCNRKKGDQRIDFREHTTPYDEEPGKALNLKSNKSPEGRHQVKDPDRWHYYLARVVNFYYECDAISDIELGARGEPLYQWEVRLFSGNDPRWLSDDLSRLVDYIRNRREDAVLTPAPDTLRVTSPDFPDVVYDEGEECVEIEGGEG
jgi:5-methylcytosine-specific restriction endonuclease McrA